MDKNLDYYMSLPYIIEVVPISDSLGGGFTARLPEIGRFAITGDGETPEEAIKSLESAKRDRFEYYLRKGIEIPEPEGEKEDFSGRFIVRIPKVLHRQLVSVAKQNGVSLNQYVNYLLSTNSILERQENHFKAIIYELDSMKEAIWDISYSIDDVFGTTFEKYEAEEIQREIEEHVEYQPKMLKAA